MAMKKPREIQPESYLRNIICLKPKKNRYKEMLSRGMSSLTESLDLVQFVQQ